MNDFWILVSSMVIIGLSGVIYAIIACVQLINDYEYRLGRNHFYQGIITIMKNNKDDSVFTSEVITLYKENSKRNPRVAKKFPTLVELLDDFVYNLNTVPEVKWKKNYKIEYPSEFRSRLLNLTSIIKKKNPYNSYSGRNIGKVNTLLEDTELSDDFKNALHELIDDLEVYEYQNRDGYKLSKKSYYYSLIFGVVGVVGTLFTVASTLF
ncbi:MAG: hypothetical protein NAG76_14430 [Candidatus Pristimantibacillus lignocellulolyticus]|uniref:Uncharacterized protein n=1 Tax=Candidatus Pristimantibacillus lignocellulolyticus TaxID=2994561 RepID=A0A9J6ZAF3_9BACL|nr:MAG: hypothetical protein NAG76_14430 [Candidatus Pristimantibacillus lignocellulolyticus]